MPPEIGQTYRYFLFSLPLTWSFVCLFSVFQTPLLPWDLIYWIRVNDLNINHICKKHQKMLRLYTT